MPKYNPSTYVHNYQDGPHLTEAGVQLVIEYYNSKYNSSISFPIAEYNYTESAPESYEDHIQRQNDTTPPIRIKPRIIHHTLDSSYEKNTITIKRLLSQIPKKDTDYRHAFILYALNCPALFVFIQEKGHQAILYLHSVSDESARLFAQDICKTTGLPVFFMASKKDKTFTECLMYGKYLTSFDLEQGRYCAPTLLTTLNNDRQKAKLSFIPGRSKIPTPMPILAWFSTNKTTIKEFSDPDMLLEAKNYPAIVATQFIIQALQKLGRSSEITDFVSKIQKLKQDNLSPFLEGYIQSLPSAQSECQSMSPREIPQQKERIYFEEQCPLLNEVKCLLKPTHQLKLLFVLSKQDKSLLKLLCPPDDLTVIPYLLDHYPKELNAEFWYQVCKRDARYIDLVLADEPLIYCIAKQNLLYYFGYRLPSIVEKLLSKYPHLLQEDEKEAFKGIIQCQNEVASIEKVTDSEEDKKQYCLVS